MHRFSNLRGARTITACANKTSMRGKFYPGEGELPPRVFLPSGKELRLVPLERTKHPLYTSAKGECYTIFSRRFKRLKEYVRRVPKKKRTGKRQHKHYQLNASYNNILVHHAVLEAWVGPQPKGYECDHLNGNSLDNRVENLEWVTHQENMRRRKVLYNCKGLGFNGQPMKRQLIQLEINFKESPTAALPLTNTQSSTARRAK